MDSLISASLIKSRSPITTCQKEYHIAATGEQCDCCPCKLNTDMC